MSDENKENKDGEGSVNQNLDLSKEIETENQESKPEEKEAAETEESEVADITWAEQEKLKKFGGDAEKLAKSYLELEKKMSSNKPAKELKDDELIEFNKKFYGDLIDEKSIHENELAEISEATAKELGIATKVTDAMAAKIKKDMATKLVNSRIKAANEVMGDPEKRRAVINAIKAKGGEYAQKFNGRLQTGGVTEEELSLLQEAGALNVEAELGLEGDTEVGSFDDAAQELEDITIKQAHIWGDPNHPQYFKVEQKRQKLKRKLGMA